MPSCIRLCVRLAIGALLLAEVGSAACGCKAEPVKPAAEQSAPQADSSKTKPSATKPADTTRPADSKPDVAPAPPAEHAATSIDRLEPYECGSITRVHTLGGVFLASQPSPSDFAQAKKVGVKTVINLRHESEIKEFDEKKVVEGEGLVYVNIPFDGPGELADEVFDKAREQLKTAARPILMHCSSANRVGAIWLAHRVLDGRVSWEDALAEAKTVGLRSPDYETKAKAYIERGEK